jgi:hypothetical protein
MEFVLLEIDANAIEISMVPIVRIREVGSFLSLHFAFYLD